MWTKATSEKGKFGSSKKTTPRLNYEWIGKTINKKIRSKNWKKNSSNQNEIAAYEQKFIFFVHMRRFNTKNSTPFSHSTLKLERKKFTPQNHSFSRSASCFGGPKSLLQFDFKNHENEWTDLEKKDSGPIQSYIHTTAIIPSILVPTQLMSSRARFLWMISNVN